MGGYSQYKQHFNPRSPRGERRGAERCGRLMLIFQSTLPARGATWVGFTPARRWPFQSTLPARGATDGETDGDVRALDFNPRSPRGERPADALSTLQAENISIHAPREGSDYAEWMRQARRVLFQSTLPARGATGPLPPFADCSLYFNPRSPRGERRDKSRSLASNQGNFNPRSPRGERP